MLSGETGSTHFSYINIQQNPEVPETIWVNPINPGTSQCPMYQAQVLHELDPGLHVVMVLCPAISCLIVSGLYVLTHVQLCISASTQALPGFAWGLRHSLPSHLDISHDLMQEIFRECPHTLDLGQEPNRNGSTAIFMFIPWIHVLSF